MRAARGSQQVRPGPSRNTQSFWRFKHFNQIEMHGHHDDPGGRKKGWERGREEDRGRERDRYNESDKNRASKRGRDSDREYTPRQRPSKPFNHVTELNKQILSSSDTRALFRGRDGPDRQTYRGKDRDEERVREREISNEREKTSDRELGRDGFVPIVA